MDRIADYPALLELLGTDEFERTICPIAVARERYRGYQEGRQEGYAILEAYETIQLARGMPGNGTGATEKDGGRGTRSLKRM